MPVDPDNPFGNEWELIADSPSDVCLSCHATQIGAVFGSDPLAPPPEKGGGNFVFLLEDNLNDGVDGVTNPIPGDAAGHNINAPAYGLAADGTWLFSPGGTFPSDQLGCTSCHDPHGNENFRFLRGPGPSPHGTPAFTSPAPLADGIDLQIGEEGPTNHSAYRSGMTSWCSNCHNAYVPRHHGEGHGGSHFRHPTNRGFGIGYANNYNIYNGTDDPSGGSQLTAYLAEVPFEDGSNTTSSTSGPSQSSRIMCLSCHRAHGSSGPQAGRWDFNVALLIEDGVISGSYPIPDPYDSPTQGSLCEKCHISEP